MGRRRHVEVTRTANHEPFGCTALDLPSAWNVINADDYVLGQQLTFWVPATIAGCDGLKHNLATAPRNYFDLRASYILLKREHVPIQVRQRRRIIVENSPPHTDPRNP